MTEYEKLSLTLLAQIASGMSFQLSALNPGYSTVANQQTEQIVAWQGQLTEAMKLVLEAIQRNTNQ